MLLNVCKQTFCISHVRISQTVKGVLSEIFGILFSCDYEIVYKKTDEWYIEWQQVTTNDNEWQQVAQQMITSDNEWHNEWQRATKNGHWVTASESNGKANENGTVLQRVDDSNHFNDKKRYTTTSRDGRLQLKLLNK